MSLRSMEGLFVHLQWPLPLGHNKSLTAFQNRTELKNVEKEFAGSSSNQRARTFLKLPCDRFKYVLKKQKSFFYNTKWANKFWSSRTGEVKLMMKFFMYLPNFSELWNVIPRVAMGYCLRCFFRATSCYIFSFKKFKALYKIPKLFWYKVFVHG